MEKLTKRQQVVYDFIKEYMQEHGMPPTRAEIAQALGFKSPNAAEEHIRALARKGAISMIKGASRGIRLTETTEEEVDEGLPVIGRVAAGSPILASEHVEQQLNIPADFFSPRADYLLKVHGMSMKNVGIYEGDLIAVHRTQAVRDNDIVIARVDNEVTVKRLQKQKNRILLLPENEELSPIEVGPDQDFAIEGLYVGVIRRH